MKTEKCLYEDSKLINYIGDDWVYNAIGKYYDGFFDWGNKYIWIYKIYYNRHI